MEDSLTTDIHIEMVELTNVFWTEFSKLCNQTLDKLSDQKYRDNLEEMLGEHTSVYGRDTEIK